MNKPTVVFNGQKYRKYDRYFRATSSTCERYLHRAVWIYHNGPIPEGHHIHHVDGDVYNNDISNLECLLRAEHVSIHAKERGAQAAANLAKYAIPVSHKNRSKESYRVSGRKSWVNRKHTTVQCTVCNVSYQTKVPYLSKFCSNTCSQRAFRARRPDYYRK